MPDTFVRRYRTFPWLMLLEVLIWHVDPGEVVEQFPSEVPVVTSSRLKFIDALE